MPNQDLILEWKSSYILVLRGLLHFVLLPIVEKSIFSKNDPGYNVYHCLPLTTVYQCTVTLLYTANYDSPCFFLFFRLLFLDESIIFVPFPFYLYIQHYINAISKYSLIFYLYSWKLYSWWIHFFPPIYSLWCTFCST